jgi:photosystem II stability/assembly factor-like uncharacterized protein
MKKYFVITILLIVISIPLYLFLTNSFKFHYFEENESEDIMKPGEWFHYQRAYPQNEIDYNKYFDAMETKRIMMESDEMTDLAAWQSIGPSNIGGRITAMAVDPSNPNIIIIGGAAGGVLKSTDNGVNWIFKSDNWSGQSIGALTMDPNNSNIIYCGTGEANSAIDNYPGFGIYKSTDKGDSWFFLGLENALHIGAIDVSKQNSNVVFSAVLGYRSFSQNKGIYKSTNAGVNWTRVLFVSDSTSGIDVKVNPGNQNIVYAAMWERVRTPPSISKTGGITSGLYRSTNGGNNWTLLGTANGLPSPSATTGRISIAISKSNPSVVYSIFKTTIDNNILGVYKSTNDGLNWITMTMNGIESSSFDWYFGLIEVHPTNPDIVFIGSVDLFKYNSSSWTNLTYSYSGSFDMQHPDQHVLWINPANVNNLIVGNDGGIFVSSNAGANWTKRYNLPLTQFYASTIDYLQPTRKVGGSQDNGTEITYDGLANNWTFIYGGDGFVTQVDYTNSNVLYCESQNGALARSTDAGNNFISITIGLSGRFNWCTPFILDIQNPNIIYVGSNMLFRSTNQGDSWVAISGDLTRGANGKLGTITCVSNAVLTNTQRVLYVGTDDAKVSVSTNSGTNWTDITGTLPQRYVTDVICDKRNPAIAYVTLSGFNMDERNFRVFRTTNYGANWTNISGNLLNVPANSIVIDYNRDSVLYVGCDAGVYYTKTLGNNWYNLGSGLPNSPVLDLNFHQPTKKLVAATHGRSMYEISVQTLPIGINEKKQVADDFSLEQNYPNPFNPSTIIKYSLKKHSKVVLTVYDIEGKQVVTLVNENKKSGTYEVKFSAAEYRLASGVYIYSLYTDKNTISKKMVLIK